MTVRSSHLTAAPVAIRLTSPSIARQRASSCSEASRTEEARQALEKAIAIGAETFDMYVRRRVPWHRPEDYEHMLDGLRKAGWQG
jgi:adenylate cyclase